MPALPPFLIGLGAGCATALLLAALLKGTAYALPLFLISPLPVAIAALGWGAVAGGVAVLTVGAALLPLGSLEIALAAMLLIAAPAAIVAAYLCRPWSTPDVAAMLWQPLGRGLLLGSGLVAGALVAVGILIGFDAERLAAETSAALRLWLAAPGASPRFTEADIDAFARMNMAVLPYTTAALGVAMLVVSLWLGNRIVNLSGRHPRPVKPLWTAELPPAAGIIFILALAASFLGPPLGTAAAAVAGAFGIAETLIGLAVLHALTRGMSARPAILATVYIVMVVLQPAIAVLALLGVAEGFMRFRARAAVTP